MVISDPAAPDPQLAAARELIEKMDLRPYVKVLDGGDLEVTIVREGTVVRHVIDPFGRVTSVELQRPPLLLRRASKIAIVAWLVGIASIAAAGALEDHVPLKAIGVIFACCIAVFVVAALALTHVDSRARKRYEQDGSVLDVVSLHATGRSAIFGTVAQMLAAERLAAEHDDHAVARVRGDGSVDLVVEGDGMLESFVVDRDGGVAEVHRAAEQPDGRAALLRVVGGALILGGIAAAWVAAWTLLVSFLGLVVIGSAKRSLAARAAAGYGGVTRDWRPIERRDTSD